jgi:hypothetical protein
MARALRFIPRGLAPFAVLALLAAPSSPAHGAATITILNNDGAGEGFNDPTFAAPVGGNPGTTVGQQRLNVFQHAANIWGSILTSSVPIIVRAQFNPQTCTATSAVLGSAGPVTIHRDFAGADFTGTWYHAALANKLAGVDLDLVNPDINATFNSNLNGSPTCLGGTGWYLGFDGNEGSSIELLPVVLHELGHGLGFSTTTSGTSGNFNAGFPSVYDRFLFDNTTGLLWVNMTAAQRVASAVNTGNLAWNGPAAFAAAQSFLSKRPRMLVTAPGGIAGTYACNGAAFGAPLTPGGVTGTVVLVDDGTGTTSDGCEPLVNGAALAGNIALIDRGTCTFVIKAAAAQAAGAIAVIIANNATGPLTPGGADPSITIPVVGITQADGNTLKANLGAGVTVTLGLDPVLLAGADNSGRPLMYAPNPFQGGSSVSHWDVTLTPNALMEPAINNDLSSSVDLTDDMFQDIGWFPGVTAVALAQFTTGSSPRGVTLRWAFGNPAEVAVVAIERAAREAGPWEALPAELGSDGAFTTALDASAVPGVTYWYRLKVTETNGDLSYHGPVSGRFDGAPARTEFVGGARPNPSASGTAVAFRLARPEFVRLAVLDAGGRRVRTLHEGMLAAGEHTRAWDGRAEGAGLAMPGVYLVSMTTSEGTLTQRVAVVR